MEFELLKFVFKRTFYSLENIQVLSLVLEERTEIKKEENNINYN